MKNMLPWIVSLVVLNALAPPAALAGSVASLWNGDDFNMSGIFFLQDAEKKSQFYWAPSHFDLHSHSDLQDGPDGDPVVVNTPEFTNKVITKVNGKKYSVYSFRVVLAQPDRFDLVRARQVMTKKFGFPIVNDQMAPICGISMGIPAISGAAPATDDDSFRITYGFSETPQGACTQANIPQSFPVQVQVPIEYEPAIAEAMVRGVGIPLPTVKLYHPYKYVDNIHVHIDAVQLYSLIKDVKSISGGIAFVQASLNDALTNALNTLQVMGQFTMNIQNQDPKVQERMQEIVLDLVKNVFFKFAVPDKGQDLPADPAFPGACKPDTSASSVISMAGGKSVPMCVSASLSKTETEAKDLKVIDFDLNNTNYSTIYSDTDVRLRAIPQGMIDPAIQAMDSGFFKP